MAIFVINEWLWSDAAGSNNVERPSAQREAFDLIVKLAASDHRTVVIAGSSFDQKAYRLCKNTNPMIVQRIGGIYVGNLRFDSNRCLALNPDETASIPDEFAAATNPDDHYLVRALLSVQGSILITTDGKLRNAVVDRGLICLFREEFLAAYFPDIGG